MESSYPINTRSQRIIDSLKNCEVHICTWDRLGVKSSDSENYSIYRSPNVGYGNKVLKLAYLLRFALFFRRVLHERKPDIIIASHWDMLLIASLFKGKEKLVYDNLDIPEFKIGFIEKIIIFIEKLSLTRVDAILLASRFYAPLYKNYNSIVFENLPVTNCMGVEERKASTSVIKVGFVGSVRHYELLKNLILAVDNEMSIQLHIYGDGIANDKLKSFCKKLEVENVFFHGRFNYNEIGNIYKCIDVLWAAYPYKSRNVKYAISNKFHESIYYTIPCIFSEKTMLGDYVKLNCIGVTVDPYCQNSIKSGIDN
ncbi:glycosyltransferase, partial [Pseudoalteromonas sp. Isolate6]|uniref:glycosyltransferase n=1 Tax=Pseudoalteromonas sp. Isolate6 TaxID=2908527 RepID=UPI001EFEC9A9